MKKGHFVFFLEDSILVIWNQEALLDSWTDLSLVQNHLIQLGLLNGGFMNLVVHILYNDACLLHPFLLSSESIFASSSRCLNSGLSGTGNLLLCGASLKADGRFQYSIELLFLDVCPET
jgi:hypothetical protein